MNILGVKVNYSIRKMVITLGILLSFSASSQAAIIEYDSEQMNYVTGIKELKIGDFGWFNVRFLPGTFNQVYGTTATTADLTFADSRSAAIAANAILDALVLSNVQPGNLGGQLFTGSLRTLDALFVPYVANAFYSVRMLSYSASSGTWGASGSGLLGDRDSLMASRVCSSCAPTKWAVFESVEVSEPSALALFITGALLFRCRRKNKFPRAVTGRDAPRSADSI
ncbi:hypothetical protein [Alteromonas oceanisediminis]|uniref:hypothetical protein n=1 Tax=Alteromonas oceanisediminis TaxID=2836180 RepID=UPI001BDA8D04|nr:hypothetical protein [Alteromonas oceanisediminis]MBT0586901.1 hypothetical protein [Alteromonas oceanisediminis]